MAPAAAGERFAHESIFANIILLFSFHRTQESGWMDLCREVWNKHKRRIKRWKRRYRFSSLIYDCTVACTFETWHEKNIYWQRISCLLLEMEQLHTLEQAATQMEIKGSATAQNFWCSPPTPRLTQPGWMTFECSHKDMNVCRGNRLQSQWIYCRRQRKLFS